MQSDDNDKTTLVGMVNIKSNEIIDPLVPISIMIGEKIILQHPEMPKAIAQAVAVHLMIGVMKEVLKGMQEDMGLEMNFDDLPIGTTLQ